MCMVCLFVLKDPIIKIDYFKEISFFQSSVSSLSTLKTYKPTCAVLGRSVMSDSLWPHWLYPPGPSVHGDSPGNKNWSGLPCLPPGNLSNPGIEPTSPALQADFLLSKPPGMPMSTGVGSLSLHQGIFPTLELNRGLLHCRWILYHHTVQM